MPTTERGLGLGGWYVTPLRHVVTHTNELSGDTQKSLGVDITTYGGVAVSVPLQVPKYVL